MAPSGSLLPHLSWRNKWKVKLHWINNENDDQCNEIISLLLWCKWFTFDCYWPLMILSISGMYNPKKSVCVLKVRCYFCADSQMNPFICLLFLPQWVYFMAQLPTCSNHLYFVSAYQKQANTKLDTVHMPIVINIITFIVPKRGIRALQNN